MKWIWLLGICVMAWADPPKVILANPACDTVAFEGNQILLLAYSFEEDITYTWSLSTGEVLTGDNVLVSFEGTGFREVTLVATNSAGESSPPQKRLIYFTDPFSFATTPEILGLIPTKNTVPPNTTVRIDPVFEDADQDGPYEYFWCWTADDVTYRANTPVLETSFGLLEGETERTYTVTLFVVDQAGNASFTGQTSIFVSSGNLPPSAKIVVPATSVIDVQAGTNVTFLAEATDAEGNLPVSYLWYFPDGTTATTPETAFRFEEEGFFAVSLTVTDSLGNQTPFTQSVIANVVPAVNPDIPDTFIQLPSASTRIFTGESLILSGIIAGVNPDLRGLWTIVNLDSGQELSRLEGNRPGRFKFDHSGLYLIRYSFTQFGIENDATYSNTRLIAVHDRDENQAPVLQYDRSQALISVRNGNPYEFTANVTDPDGDPLTLFWMLEGNLQPVDGTTINLTANLPDEAFTQGVAYQTLRMTALDDKGKAARQPLIFSVAVYKDRKPPEPKVNSRAVGEVVYAPFNQAYPVQAVIQDDPGVPLIYRWTISYVDDFLNPVFQGQAGLELPPLQLDRPGIVSISLSVETSDGTLRNAYGHTHYLYAYDPEAFPETAITKPKGEDLVVEVGSGVSFEGLVTDPNLFVSPEDTFGFTLISTTMLWTIRRDGEVIGTFPQNEPLTVVFDQTGSYQVQLAAENSLGLQAAQVDELQIQVIGVRPDDAFEPNDTREMAASLVFGSYGGLSVDAGDAVDWYSFQLAQAGSAIELEFDLSNTQDPADVSIFLDEDLVAQNKLQAGRRHPFTFVGARAGKYYLKLETDAESVSKRAVSFGFSILVSNPRLVFSYPKTDEVDRTFLTLVNPTQQDARATLVARNQKGEMLAEADAPLRPNGHSEFAVEDVFPGLNPLDIGWVQVRSDQNILGLSTTMARDELTAIAEPAHIGSLDELIIPHIAQDTGTWFTQASVVNHSGEVADARFRSAAGEFELPNLNEINERTLIDFEQFFGGQLPTGSDWGSFVEAEAKPGLAGLEIFGTKNGSPRIASLNLSSDKLRNPNFTYVSKNLYFPHIAEDTATFFTGVAFVNTAETPVDIVLVAYNREGEVLATLPKVLQGFEKVVDLAENLFPGLPIDSKMSWLELKTNGPVQGYTIFGDNRGANALLAGLTAIPGGAKDVYFQKVFYEQGRYWTGLAVVNVSGESQANLTYQAYNGEGQVVATANATIQPHQKDLNLIDRLFDPEILPQVRWVKLSSDQPLAAFELFGDLAGNFLAGCVAQ